MDSSTLFTNWSIGLGIAAVVVIIAAALLISVWLAARRILVLALAALELVKQIKGNSLSIWKLQETNNTAEAILKTTKAIREHGEEIVEALHKTNTND